MAGRSGLAGVDELTPEQCQEAHELLFGRPPEAEVVASIEDRVASERRCPHCGSDGAVKRGSANGLRRYRCKACAKSFNALTGTPLARLRHKECWLAFAETLRAGATVRGSADHCGVATTTAFRWRHRFLKGVKTGAAPLRGIVEADDPQGSAAKPMFWTATKASVISTARPASAVGKPANAACRANRSRFWSRRTAAAPP